MGKVSGTAASRGRATGPVRIVYDPSDLWRVEPGDVLVCPVLPARWVHMLDGAAAVVVETGGVLSAAATIARERRLPLIVAAIGATRHLHDGEWVEVDAIAGEVRPAVD